MRFTYFDHSQFDIHIKNQISLFLVLKSRERSDRLRALSFLEVMDGPPVLASSSTTLLREVVRLCVISNHLSTIKFITFIIANSNKYVPQDCTIHFTIQQYYGVKLLK